MQPAVARRMSGGQWALLGGLSVLWGGSFFFVGVAVRELPSLSIAVCRTGLTALFLGAWMLARGHRLPRGAAVWRAFFVLGLLNNVVPFFLLVWGQHHIGSGLASILNATTPLFTVLVAHVWTRDEQLDAAKAAGVVVGFCGVVVMLGRGATAGPGGNLLAQGACLLAALSYAFSGVYGRRFARMGVSPIATGTFMSVAATAMLLPLALMVEQPWTLPLPSAPVLASLLGIGLLSGALAYAIFFRLLETAGATNLMLVTFLIPVSAILAGALALGERLAPAQYAGMALIGAGLALIDGRVLRGRMPRNVAGVTDDV